MHSFTCYSKVSKAIVGEIVPRKLGVRANQGAKDTGNGTAGMPQEIKFLEKN